MSSKKAHQEVAQVVLPSEPVKIYNNYREFVNDFNYHDPNYAFYYKFIKRPISYPLTWLVYKKTSLRPNQLTLFGFIFAALAALFFLQATPIFFILGAISFFIFDIFDDFDGIIARSKAIRSRRGGWLDILAGCIGKYIILGTIAIGVFRMTGDPMYLIMGIVAVMGMASVNNIDHVTKIRFSVVVQQKMKFEDVKPDAKTLAGKLSVLSEIALNIWFVLLIVCGLFNILPIFIIYSALYYLFYPVFQFVYLNHKYKNV